MADTNKFFSKYWRAIAWTAFYVFAMWCILHYLFNFDMFSYAHWVRLARVELHGFAGLVFGLLILAAVPLYIATTTLTIRNNAVPVRVPLPKCFEAAPPPPPPAPPPPLVTEQDVLPEPRPGAPAEMREVFMRAQKNYGSRQQSVFNRAPTKSVVNAPNVVADAPGDVPAPDNVPVMVGAADVSADQGANAFVDTNSAFPVPNDFDVVESDDMANYGVPVFSDINFDDGADEDDGADNEKSPADELCEFIMGAGIDAHVENDLIIAGNFAIAVHDDDDFWVADDTNWFAAGRQRPSPIAQLIEVGRGGAKTPILYLGEYNIMDFEDVSEKWRAAGIEIITDRDALIEKLNS